MEIRTPIAVLRDYLSTPEHPVTASEMREFLQNTDPEERLELAREAAQVLGVELMRGAAI